jgi:hypothetical protein
MRKVEDMKDMDEMNDRRAGPRGRTGRPRRRRAGALAVMAGASVLAAGCGGSSTQANTFAPGATYTQALAFAKCMRSNGVPQFPAPTGQGNFNTAQIYALVDNSAQANNAMHLCRSVLPNAGTGLTVEQIQQIQQQNITEAVKAAHCMRAHGITNFPDPAATTQASGVNWNPVFSAGFPNDSPGYAAAYKACGGGDGAALGPFLAPGAAAPPVSGNGS